jgi:hypothetical protein
MDEEQPPVSRYHGLIELQLKEDARYDLCSEAWRRIGAMLVRELAEYLECPASKVTLSPLSRDATETPYSVELRVELANGFTPAFTLWLELGTRAALTGHHRPYAPPNGEWQRRFTGTVDEVALAWTPEIEREYRADLWSSKRASVATLDISESRRPVVTLSFAYYPHDEEGRIPPLDPFVLAVSTFQPGGAFAKNAVSLREIAEYGRFFEGRLKEEIKKRGHERSTGAEPGEPVKPTWL